MATKFDKKLVKVAMNSVLYKKSRNFSCEQEVFPDSTVLSKVTKQIQATSESEVDLLRSPKQIYFVTLLKQVIFWYLLSKKQIFTNYFLLVTKEFFPASIYTFYFVTFLENMSLLIKQKSARYKFFGDLWTQVKAKLRAVFPGRR